MALNPDFSEIGTDDPKVQVNQRYEIIFPERRPFFLENASIFTTPEQLFFSRRIVNPQFGMKLTGSIGRWSLGALAADDRGPGEVLAQGQTGHGDRAVDGLFRVEREFGHQSHLGLFLAGTSFQSTSNRVGSLDLRYVFPGNWTLAGQATTTQTQLSHADSIAGPGYKLTFSKYDNHVSFQNYYTDRSRGMNSTLGYIPRTDTRSPMRITGTPARAGAFSVPRSKPSGKPWWMAWPERRPFMPTVRGYPSSECLACAFTG